MNTLEYLTDTQKEIIAILGEIQKVTESMAYLVIEKNKRYGDSAIRPLNVFCKSGNTTQIETRLDDKLNRIINSSELRKNDVSDLIGYLVLLCVAKGWTDFSDLID